MDGRVQDAVADFGRKKFGAQFADTITEAGIVGLLSKETLDPELLKSLQFKIVDVSVGKHHSVGIIVDGHAECAGNPVADVTHKNDIRKSVAIISKMVAGKVPVIGVFVVRSENGWKVEEV